MLVDESILYHSVVSVRLVLAMGSTVMLLTSIEQCRQGKRPEPRPQGLPKARCTSSQELNYRLNSMIQKSVSQDKLH
jgi:hypothetical protein